MKLARILGVWVFVGTVGLLFNSSGGFAATIDSPSPVKILPAVQAGSPVQVQAVQSVNRSSMSLSRTADISLGVTIPVSQVPEPSFSPEVIEPSLGLSLDQLRRKAHRYPDQDLLGRFAEAATECPPLFD